MVREVGEKWLSLNRRSGATLVSLIFMTSGGLSKLISQSHSPSPLFLSEDRSDITEQASTGRASPCRLARGFSRGQRSLRPQPFASFSPPSKTFVVRLSSLSKITTGRCLELFQNLFWHFTSCWRLEAFGASFYSHPVVTFFKNSFSSHDLSHVSSQSCLFSHVSVLVALCLIPVSSGAFCHVKSLTVQFLVTKALTFAVPGHLWQLVSLQTSEVAWTIAAVAK